MPEHEATTGGQQPVLDSNETVYPPPPSWRPRIGIDIGGVIIADDEGDDNIFFSRDYLCTPQVPGAFEAIAELGTWASCFLVSKIGTTKRQRCRRWLFAHQIPDRCDIPPERWHFTESRSAKGLLAEQLQLNAFVDDHLDVLTAMPPTLRCRILFGSQTQATDGFLHAPDWPTDLRLINRCLRKTKY
jgi:hypothetical protein